MIFKDYYKILELKTNRVSSEQIKNAYRLAVKKNHPDLNVKDSLAEEKIKDINEAYKILSDSIAKRKYDRIWSKNLTQKRRKEYEEENRKNNSAFGELFNMFFGNVENSKEKNKTKVEKTPIKGENIETSIDVNIEEVFYGLDKKISLRAVDGKMKVFTVSIPAGIRNGEKIRLLGQGKEGIDGGKNGDLFIKINIENNKKFKLYGCDILTNVYVSPWEAALGKKINIDSIEENITLNIPAGIQSGEQIIIPSKGYKDGQGGRGNLIAEIKTVVPKELTEEEKELFTRLQDISTFNPRV